MGLGRLLGHTGGKVRDEWGRKGYGAMNSVWCCRLWGTYCEETLWSTDSKMAARFWEGYREGEEMFWVVRHGVCEFGYTHALWDDTSTAGGEVFTATDPDSSAAAGNSRLAFPRGKSWKTWQQHRRERYMPCLATDRHTHIYTLRKY